MSDERDVNLMGYLPPYYHDNKEMLLITEAENPEVSELWDMIASVKRNQFILDSDEFRIRQWEKLLRIRPDYVMQSLDYRKAVVIMRLSTRLPLTYRWLIAKLIDVVGLNNFMVYLYHDRYLINIQIVSEMFGIIRDLTAYLREKIPANLSLELDIPEDFSFDLYTGVHVEAQCRYELVFLSYDAEISICSMEGARNYTIIENKYNIVCEE